MKQAVHKERAHSWRYYKQSTDTSETLFVEREFNIKKGEIRGICSSGMLCNDATKDVKCDAIETLF